MNKNIIIFPFLLVTILLAVVSYSQSETKELSTLTGTIHYHTKALTPAYLKIDGCGQINLCGTKIKNIREGTRVLLKGEIKSRLFVSQQPSPFSTQWIICMYVEEIKTTNKPFGNLAEREIKKRKINIEKNKTPK